MVDFPVACLNSSSYASILNTSLETSMTWTFLQIAGFFLHLKGGAGAACPLFLSGFAGEPEFCAVPGGWSTWEGHRGSPGRTFHSFRAAQSSGSQDCRPEPLPVFMGTSHPQAKPILEGWSRPSHTHRPTVPYPLFLEITLARKPILGVLGIIVNWLLLLSTGSGGAGGVMPIISCQAPYESPSLH